MALDSVKKIAAEFALDKAINYITKDPDKNLFYAFRFCRESGQAPGQRVVKT